MEQVVGAQTPAEELSNLAVVLGCPITFQTICPPGTDQNIVANVAQAVVDPVNGRGIIICLLLPIPAVVQLDSEDGAMSRQMIEIGLGNIKGGSGFLRPLSANLSNSLKGKRAR
jgi:hypothetical protein